MALGWRLQAALVSDVLGLPRKALYDDALRLRQSQDAAD